MEISEIAGLLKKLISTPSPSGEEQKAALLLRDFLSYHGVEFQTSKNNTWAVNLCFDQEKPVIMLNSHIDTVRPVPGWKSDPFQPLEEGDRITGLGSNDAGASLVCLLMTFFHFYRRDDLPFNLVFTATAEEENSGPNGVRIILDEIPRPTFVIVGEPTGMSLSIAERGLLVLDCLAVGKAGHAAREEGENALYKAIADIELLRRYRFDKVSDLLGPVKITVTQIEAGTQHNVIPDVCRFVVDVRTNEHYSNKEVYQTLAALVGAQVTPRSFRLNSSGISLDHPFAQRARELNLPFYGSPTTSDQAVIPFPSVKIGPGDSSRSHTAGEYILMSELAAGVDIYIRLLEGLRL